MFLSFFCEARAAHLCVSVLFGTRTQHKPPGTHHRVRCSRAHVQPSRSEQNTNKLLISCSFRRVGRSSQTQRRVPSPLRASGPATSLVVVGRAPFAFGTATTPCGSAQVKPGINECLPLRRDNVVTCPTARGHHSATGDGRTVRLGTVHVGADPLGADPLGADNGPSEHISPTTMSSSPDASMSSATRREACCGF